MKNPNVLILLGLLSLDTAQANRLDSQLKQASGPVAVSAAPAGQLQAFKNQLNALFNDPKAPADWQAVQMQHNEGQGIVTLQELPDAKQGRGFFAVRPRARHNILVQAPHADSDLFTGKIATRLFLEGDFKAAQWNTVKRDLVDMAHTPDTYWQVFTEVFAGQYPDGKIIQLHGFDQARRKTQAGASSGVILSAGHTLPPPWVQKTAQCLQQVFPDRVSLYQADVHELGGTTNVQGQLLRSLGYEGFLHIEMGKDLRKQLLDDAGLRKRFIACL